MNGLDNNRVNVIGEIISGFTFNHELFGEGFYTADLAVERTSGNKDILPLMVSERLVDVHKDHTGRTVEINGQFRSYNLHGGMKNRLVLSVFAAELQFIGKPEDGDRNEIYLDGYICKPPIYRKTPLGREITDLLLAVNRAYGKSDYIPCISWGRNARYASMLQVGSRLRIWGRIQSREYIKKLSETESETRVAYEVSVSGMEEEN